MKNTAILIAALALASCGDSTTARDEAAREAQISEDIDNAVISLDQAEANLKAAEDKQKAVTVGDNTITADNVDASVQDAMKAAQQASSTNVNAVATTEQYFNGVN